MEKKWIASIDGRKKTEPEILNEIFKLRKVKDVDNFLNPSDSFLYPGLRLDNIDIAAEVVLSTIKNNGKFFVYFDSDTDGCTAGAIAYRYIKNYTDNVVPYINNGKVHGIKEFDFSLLDDVDTVVIVDAMENTTENYDKILAMGKKITIWDHHLIPDAVLNISEKIALVSSQYDYPNPELSGSGVSWKVCKYIDEVTGNHYADDLMDLAAVGLVADMCSLGTDSMENRYICHMGFANPVNPAIRTINGSYTFDSTAVSFGIAPLINSANRVEKNEDAVKLFISDDMDEVKKLVKTLKDYKEQQNTEVMAQMPNLEAQAQEQINNKCLFFFVDSDLDIAGLLGNKLLEKYGRPLFILKKDANNPDQYSGSMRAVGVHNMTAMVNSTALASCMGHPNAAGFVCNICNFEPFKKAIQRKLSNITFTQETKVDVKIFASQVTESLIESVKAINRLTGGSFKPVTFMIEDVDDYEIGAMSNGKHLKLSTPDMIFIKWNFSDWENLDPDGSLSAIGTLDAGFFGRKFYLQMIMNDFKIEEKIEF